MDKQDQPKKQLKRPPFFLGNGVSTPVSSKKCDTPRTEKSVRSQSITSSSKPTLSESKKTPVEIKKVKTTAVIKETVDGRRTAEVSITRNVDIFISGAIANRLPVVKNEPSTPHGAIPKSPENMTLAENSPVIDNGINASPNTEGATGSDTLDDVKSVSVDSGTDDSFFEEKNDVRAAHISIIENLLNMSSEDQSDEETLMQGDGDHIIITESVVSKSVTTNCISAQKLPNATEMSPKTMPAASGTMENVPVTVEPGVSVDVQADDENISETMSNGMQTARGENSEGEGTVQKEHSLLLDDFVVGGDDWSIEENVPNEPAARDSPSNSDTTENLPTVVGTPATENADHSVSASIESEDEDGEKVKSGGDCVNASASKSLLKKRRSRGALDETVIFTSTAIDYKTVKTKSVKKYARGISTPTVAVQVRRSMRLANQNDHGDVDPDLPKIENPFIDAAAYANESDDDDLEN